MSVDKNSNYDEWDEIIIYGYMRDMLNDDVNYEMMILLVIISYFADGFSSFYDLSFKSISNTGHKTRQEQIRDVFNAEAKFGDIIKTMVPYYMSWGGLGGLESRPCYHIIDKDGNLIQIKNDTVPFEICKHLYNAPKYFSKIIPQFPKQLDKYDTTNYENETNYLKYQIKHDDRYIIERFGGALNDKYKRITLVLKPPDYDSRYREWLIIDFDKHYCHQFNLADFNYSHKDFDEFYEIRKDLKNMVCIKVKHIDYYPFDRRRLFSPKWELRRDYSEYMAPKSEADEMIAMINEFYKTKGRNVRIIASDVYYVWM